MCPSEPQTGAGRAAWHGLQPPCCLILAGRATLSPDSKCVPPCPPPPPTRPYLCSSFLRLTQTARCGPCGTHTLCRLHFTFWHGSLVLSSPGEHGRGVA